MLQLISLILLISGSFADPRYGLSAADRQRVALLQNNQRSIIARHGYRNLTAAGMPQLIYDARNMEFHSLQYVLNKPTKLGAKEEKEGYTLYHTTETMSDSELILADVRNRKFHANTIQWSPQQLTAQVFQTARDYIQMIWGKSGKVGCAANRWSKDAVNHTILVCKYDFPARVGREIYEVGEPCSSCSMQQNCNETTKLCVTPKKYVVFNS